MKTCKSCESKEERLFAPFGEGSEDYCSECQMEVENEMQEDQQYNYECGVGASWEGYQ
jgi:hypothetical protein